MLLPVCPMRPGSHTWLPITPDALLQVRAAVQAVSEIKVNPDDPKSMIALLQAALNAVFEAMPTPEDVIKASLEWKPQWTAVKLEGAVSSAAACRQPLPPAACLPTACPPLLPFHPPPRSTACAPAAGRTSFTPSPGAPLANLPSTP